LSNSNKLFEAIRIILDSIDNSSDISAYGRILSKTGNVYSVEVEGSIYTIKSNFNYEVSERVLVLFPRGRKTDLYLYPNK